MSRELKLKKQTFVSRTHSFGESHLADGLKYKTDSLGLRVDRVMKKKEVIY